MGKLPAKKRPATIDGIVSSVALDQMNGSDMESAINIKGQMTIPKAIREHLGLKAGDRVKFFLHPDGSMVLLPKLPAGAVRGMLNHRRRRPVTIDEMNKAAAEGASGYRPRTKRR